MTTTAALLDHLDRVSPEEREAIYVASEVRLELADVHAALKARRPCATWVMKRQFAGPPGTPLPEARAALDRVLTGESGATDAYAVLFAGPALAAVPEVRGVIFNAAAGALRERMTYFTATLAAMATLACAVYGDFDRLKGWLDLDEQIDMPTFDGLRPLKALRSRPDLAEEGWLRRAAWGHWRRYAPPALQRLAIPDGCEQRARPAVLEALEAAGAPELLDWASEGLRLWDSQIAEAVEELPAVQELRKAVLCGEVVPPAVQVPVGLREWVETAHRRGQSAAARLGALLLLRSGAPPDGLWLQVAGDLRPSDLGLLAEIAPEEVRPSFAEAAAVVDAAPDHLREALAIAAFPLHPRLGVAVGVLREHAQQLREMAGPEHRWLSAILAMAGAPLPHSGGPTPALLAAIQTVKDDLGPITAATTESLKRAIASPRKLECVEPRDLVAVERFAPEEQLIGALLLRRHAPEALTVRLAETAARAIWDLLHRPLFALRIELLEAVIAAPPDLRTLAWAMKALANTRNAQAQGDIEAMLGNITLFNRAAAVAREAGDTTIFVDAVVSAARTLTFGLLDEPGSEELRTNALKSLDDALGLPVEDGLRATTLAAKARLVFDRGAEEAVVLLREACKLADDDHWKLDIERELSLALRAVGELEEAIAVARTSLDRAPADLPKNDLGLLHAHLADVLAGSDQEAEAERHFREALRLLGDDPDGRLAYIRFADLLLRRGEAEEARNILVRLLARRERLVRADRIDVYRLLASAHASLGDALLADQAVGEALAAAQGTPWEPVLRTEAALRRADLAEVWRCVRRYLRGEEPRSREADEHFEDLLGNGSVPLRGELAAEALAWAQATRRPLLEARLLDAMFRRDEALAVLNAAVDEPARWPQLRARILRIAILPDDAVEERRTDIDAIEGLAGDPLTLAGTSLCDLAVACRLASAGEPGWVNRALWYAQHAFGKSEGHAWRPHAARAWVRIVQERVRLDGVTSSPAVCGAVRSVLPALSALAEGEDRGAQELVAALLLDGPLTHPECVAAAEAVLGRLADGSVVRGLHDRAASIRAVQAGTRMDVEPLPATFEATVPFDDRPPQWVVDVVGRSFQSTPPKRMLRDARSIALAARMRPDRADALLARWVEGAAASGEADLSACAELAQALVHDGEQGRGVWSELREAVGRLPPSSDPSVRALRQALRFAARMEDRTGNTERDLAGEAVDAQDDRALFQRAVGSMHAAREARDEEEARKYKQVAIDDLTALRGRWARSKRLGDALVSLGNAHRAPPDSDPRRAIELYEEARRLGRTDDGFLGKLHKVWADALQEIGGDENLRGAWKHVQVALRHRRDGYVRSETLFTASHIAALHPDHDDSQRVIVPASLLAEAVRNDPKVSEQTLPRLLDLLGRWRGRGEREEERVAMVDALLETYPNRREEILRSRLGVAEGPLGMSKAEARKAAEMIGDPDMEVLASVELALLPPHVQRDKLEAAARSMDREFPPEHLDSLAAENATESLLTRLAELEAEPGERPAGRAVAVFMLVVELARRGRRTLDDVRGALAAAREALPNASHAFRRHALVVAADALSPVDTVSDPVTDFDTAVELAAEAVQLEGGEGAASRDVLTTLGRALRYRKSRSRAHDLREARRLFERCVELDRRDGAGENLALDLVRLSEVEGFLGEGDEVSRIQRAIAREREAYAVASSRGMRSLCAANTAWNLTLLASREKEQAAAAITLREALGWYGRSRENWSAGDPRSIENNETVCRADLAIAEGRPDEALQIWRTRLSALRDRSAHPLDVAEAQHNLAEQLVRGKQAASLNEAIDLYREALRFRTLTADPRKYWGSCIGLARALALRASAADDADPDKDETASALRQAIQAARVLGPGAELAWAATELARLALSETETRAVDRVGDEAWCALREATPYLILHPESRMEEAILAEQIAFALANLGADEGVLAPLPGGVALGKRVSELVLRWLLRAEAPYQRRLEALFRVPADIGPTERLDWRQAMIRSEADAVIGQLAGIHARHPAWLRDDPSLAESRRWLRAVRGSLGISIRTGAAGVLVTLLDGDSGRTAVLLLRGPMLSVPPAVLGQLLRDGERRAQVLEGLVAWAEKTFISRVRGFLGSVPRRILWVPHGVFRLVPPARLFPGAVVSVSASIALRPVATSRARAASGLVVVADPDRADQSLGDAAISGARRLAEALGGAHLLLGVGSRVGPAVAEGALPGGPTVARVLSELDSAGFAVVIAHGHTEGVDDAWIELLGPGGEPEQLDIAALLRDPAAIVGLSIVLLSCETGRADAAPDRPGGVAGALLQAGAREVIAPLWPISLHTALSIGEAVCRARAEGRDLAEVLALAAGGPGSEGPMLGRVSPARRAAAAWDPSAFVIWVG